MQLFDATNMCSLEPRCTRTESPKEVKKASKNLGSFEFGFMNLNSQLSLVRDSAKDRKVTKLVP